MTDDKPRCPLCGIVREAATECEDCLRRRAEADEELRRDIWRDMKRKAKGE